MKNLCRWGMHQPGPTKIFHRGKLFTRCTECGTTLIVVRRRWSEIPIGKRVVWRKRQPGDLFAEVSPNLHQARLGFRPGRLFRRPATETTVAD